MGNMNDIENPWVFGDTPMPEGPDDEGDDPQDAAEAKVKGKAKKAKKAEPASIYPTWFDEEARTVDGKKWIKGHGPMPAKLMIVAERPADHEARNCKVFTGPASSLLYKSLTMNGVDQTSLYVTNAVKYALPRNKSVTAKDLKSCKGMLEEEIRRVQPEIVVCLGSHALHAVAGKDMSISVVRGELMDHPTLPTKVFAMHSPAFVLRSPEMADSFNKDVAALAALQRGEKPERAQVQYTCLHSAEEIRAFTHGLFLKYPFPLLVIDMEWEGKTWMDGQRYVRTCQIGYDHGKVMIFEFRNCGGSMATADEPEMWRAVKELLEDPRVSLIGHNAIADGHWLLSQGVDIRPRVVWDTMLAEYLLSETGPWDLGEVAVKYTNHGRYSLSLEMWTKAHKDQIVHGYGNVPSELLLPYSARDVDAPRQAFEAQWPLLEAEGFMKPRGVSGEYPSLWRTTMRTQELLYEVERSGLLVDPVRLGELITVYQAKRKELLGLVGQLAVAIGFHDFNPASTDDVRDLLFKYLQLAPVKTTGGKAWTDEVGNQGMDDDTEYKASTDKTTLEILQDAHPVVKHLLQFRRVDQVCKTWLRDKADGEDESSRGGGLPAKIWPDGRLHAHFMQMSDTGRFRASKPNMQNWPKKAEGSMLEIFGGKEKDVSKLPPGLRTIIVPAPGHVLIEGDFCQAELFVLAALSGDRNMWEALSTPGRDLHDLTAITAFKLKVLDPDGNEVPESVLIELAKANLAQGGSESKAFKSYVKTLTYLDMKGKRMTRDEFKETIRVSAKNVNFGIPYGRGALDIARQVKAETGSKQTIQQLEIELSEIVRAWKEETYPTAWAYMCQCGQSVYVPGFLVNPWGRKRRFHIHKGDDRADMERQAQNYPIQSTVADTAMIAMDRIERARGKLGLHFKIVNQIHDAVMLEVPEDEIEATKQMFHDTMGTIDIPVGPPFNVLRLGVDVTVYKRWGEKAK